MSNKELTEDLLLIQQINARCEVNKEIIARITAYDMSIPVILSIDSFHNGGLLEDPNSVVIHAVDDFFNDKLDYSIQKFHDLERLNNDMLPIVKKYKFFGPTPPAIAVLTAFKENYDNIHVALGKIEGKCAECDRKRNEVKEKVEDFNKKYQELAAGVNELSQTISQQYF